MARRAGRERLRLVGHRGDLASNIIARHHGGDVPAGARAPGRLAQAAATSALLTGGRFSLGVGTGEVLNEHILGDQWPPAEQRMEMLEEAVHVIRKLLTGQLISHAGDRYTVDTARLYSVPASPPPIYISGFGEKSVKRAARIGDGYVCVQPNADFVRLYRESGGGDRPVQAG